MSSADELSQATVLVIDDDPVNVRLLEAMLESGGYTDVHATTDPTRAVPIAVRIHPDLVLLDLKMPRRDGFWVLGKIREVLGPEIPVIILTALDTPSARARALASGADDFLAKPFDVNEVLLRARNLVHRRFLERELRTRNVSLEQRVAERTAALEKTVARLRRAERKARLAYVAEQEATRRLLTFDDMKNAFLTAVSHQIRTPLTSILGFARTLERRGDQLRADQRRTMIRRLAANAEQLERHVANFIDVDRMSRGIGEPRPEPTDVRALVERVVAGVELRGRAVRTRAPRAVVELDAAWAERILENLLINAVKHTPAGTSIAVRADVAEPQVEIVVDDDGPGVPDEMKGVIFEVFRSGEGPASAHSPGVGLGLALVARLAELHGGRAWVEDRRGGGASFHVTLQPAPASIHLHQREPAKPERRRRQA